jgi:hypothetical protein
MYPPLQRMASAIQWLCQTPGAFAAGFTCKQEIIFAEVVICATTEIFGLILRGQSTLI